VLARPYDILAKNIPNILARFVIPVVGQGENIQGNEVRDRTFTACGEKRLPVSANGIFVQ
jgi:hypothetical protein